LIPIRDPENSPTDVEKEALEPGPDLLQALGMAKEELNSTHHKPIEIPGVSIDPMLLVQDQSLLTNNAMIIDVGQEESGANESGAEESEAESINSIDSIARNADFVSLG
jgi:hypothetical protein